ncbi:putative antigen [Crotalus adamanteus]|uniref:Antigen n=1 Tax=Crotalus adamanteus TaxID=8729 RepID=A0AAW1CBS1_CROAD
MDLLKTYDFFLFCQISGAREQASWSRKAQYKTPPALPSLQLPLPGLSIWRELLSLPELARLARKGREAPRVQRSTVVSSSAARFPRRKMRLLLEVVPATRRSSWLFPILPLIWGFVIAFSLVNAGPTYLLAVPKIIRPGANLTIGVWLLKENPSSIRIQAQVLLANKSILQGEAVFQRDSFGTLVLPSDQTYHQSFSVVEYGISQNASATVFSQPHDYALDFLEYPRFLKPSLNFIAMVMSRDQIVDAGKKKTTTLSLTPENSWYPTACIIVFYVHDNGEIINDFLHIPVQPTFKNQNNNLWMLTDANLSEHEDYDLPFYYFDYDLATHPVSHENNPALHDGDLHVRKNFPETWLWQEIMTRSTEATINVTVPDTITSWVASAFIISENLGLGVIKIPVEAEGLEQTYSETVLLDLSKRTNLTEILNFNFPSDVVPGSERVQVTVTGELRFWASPSSGLSNSWQPRSADIEVAGYALLSHFIQQRLLEGIPIMKWLSKQRNHLGGYSSTQLNVMYNTIYSHTSKRHRSAQNQEAFDLDVYVKDDKEDINSLTLNVCTRYLGIGSSSRTGMALMEIGLLSGFSLSPNFVSLDDPVKKVEKDEGKIHLYLDSLNETQVCVAIPAVRDFKVANTQDASVTVMDYYEPRRRTVKSYHSLAQQDQTPPNDQGSPDL